MSPCPSFLLITDSMRYAQVHYYLSSFTSSVHLPLGVSSSRYGGRSSSFTPGVAAVLHLVLGKDGRRVTVSISVHCTDTVHHRHSSGAKSVRVEAVFVADFL